MNLRARTPDVALVGCALLLSAFSLSWPFGRDQGLYAYVAREWVHRGQVPYRDVLDHKTPGIYVIHALTTFAFGDHAWGIRVADIVAVLITGWLCAHLATPPQERIPNGLVGLGCVATSIFYYGFLNYWDTAQSELWYAMFGLLAIACAIRISNRSHAAIACGFASSAALMMKPPAATFVLLAGFLLLVRTQREQAPGTRRSPAPYLRTFGWLALGAGIACGPLFAYFGAKGALGAMKDIVVGANSYYVAHERGSTGLVDTLDRTQDYIGVYNPFSTIGLLGTGALLLGAVRAGDGRCARRHGLALAIAFAAFASTAMQQKFYLLHWGVMVGPAALVFTAFAASGIEWAATQQKGARGWKAFWPTTESRVVAFASATLLALFVCSGTRFRHYWDDNRYALRFWRGEISHEEFAQRFSFPEIDFSYAESEWVGEWLRQHSAAEDLVAVRGFEPQIYAISGRHMKGRFFWTTFLTAPSRAYRRSEWLEEDEADLRRNPPRFVVTLSREHTGPDSAETFYARGYHFSASTPLFTIVER